ncbi:MAG: hypothetical protein ACE5K9_04700 [Candidatus Methylomirabilales bacterium]
MKFLHATDLRQVPLIVKYGLFSGTSRAPLAIGDERGKAYTRQIVSRQLRKGWEVVILVFDVPAAWTKEAEEPAGVGFDLAPVLSSPTLPLSLLEELRAILPQGPGIVRALVQWQQEGNLVRLPPAYLDRSTTLSMNEVLVEAQFLPTSSLAGLAGILHDGTLTCPTG